MLNLNPYQITLLILFLFHHIQSQENTILFNKLSLENGLSQSTINGIYQDQQGFTWFGTQDGLNRYDGYNFLVYKNDIKDKMSISDNWIWCIYEDTRNNIWIGTYNGGLNRFDRDKNVFVNYKFNSDDITSISGNNVSCIVEDKSGNLWIGTWGGGLNLFDRESNKFIRFGLDTLGTGGLSSLNVRSLMVDIDGMLLIGTWSGLNFLNPITKKFTHYKKNKNDPGSLSDNRITNIYQDHDGNIWICTFEGGLNRFDREKNKFIQYSLNSMRLSSITEDNNGILWVATLDKGVILFDVKQNKFLNIKSNLLDKYSLSDDIINTIFKDRLGGIWIGTANRGINFYPQNRNVFENFSISEENNKGLNNSFVRSILEDKSGNIWIGTRGGGLNFYNRKTKRFNYFLHNPSDTNSLSNNSVMALLEDRNGDLWIGTDGGGLAKFDKKNNRFIHHKFDKNDDKSLNSNYIMTLKEDRAGKIWIGTSGGGLITFDPYIKKILRFVKTGKLANELSSNYIWSIMEDKNGYIWIGTWGAGLNRYDPKANINKIFYYNPNDQNSISNNTILSIYEDIQGNIWIGTLGGGLNRYHPESETFSNITENDGLPNNVVYGILEDESGNLWLSTNRGLSCFNTTTREFRNFDLYDGLQSYEFNQGAYCKGKEGVMYFGGVNGVTFFNPKNIKKNENIPPIVITDFKIFDKSAKTFFKATDELQLLYSQNFFSFEFAALDYTAPMKNKYVYILEGFDKEWVQAGSRRYASYTNLDPGRYVFRVKGSNNDEIWNEAGVAITLTITPPFWKTGWFTISIVLSIIGITFMIVRYRINRLKRKKEIQQEFSRKLLEFQENERKRISNELHDSLGQDLLIIKNSLEQFAVDQKSDLKDELLELSDLALQAVNEVREISYDLYPHILDRLGITKAIKSMLNKFESSSGIKFSQCIDEIDGIFPKNIELSLFRIVQEAVNNVVQHSGAKSCFIEIKRHKDKVSFTIRDDGKGFNLIEYLDFSKEQNGIGLIGMHERLKLLSGKISISSSNDKGTEITFNIPITIK